jgi:glycoprotease/Kae1 family metallohydrolase
VGAQKMEKEKIIILGIESTAHTFGVGIIENILEKKTKNETENKIQAKNKNSINSDTQMQNINLEKQKILKQKIIVLANEKDSYTTKTGGMIPRELAEHHYRVAPEILKRALEKAKIKPEEIDGIAFSQGPGIGNALRCGATLARQLSAKYGKPLIGVNHCIAHLEIGKVMCEARDPIMLYASGANTQIIHLEEGKYRVFGETLDIGIGNFLDSLGRKMGLGFPAGPKLDEMYFKGKKLLELPYTIKGMDLVFSGLLTATEKKIGKETNEDIAYSAMHNSFAMLAETTERALSHTGKKEVILGGGVGCSKALQKMITKMCKERNASVKWPEPQFMVDNPAMIAWTGSLMLRKGIVLKRMNESEIKPNQRTDEVEVKW